MKITKEQLKRIIKEELESVIEQQTTGGTSGTQIIASAKQRLIDAAAAGKGEDAFVKILQAVDPTIMDASAKYKLLFLLQKKLGLDLPHPMSSDEHGQMSSLKDKMKGKYEKVDTNLN